MSFSTAPIAIVKSVVIVKTVVIEVSHTTRGPLTPTLSPASQGEGALQGGKPNDSLIAEYSG